MSCNLYYCFFSSSSAKHKKQIKLFGNQTALVNIDQTKNLECLKIFNFMLHRNVGNNIRMMGECKWLCHFWVNYHLMVMFEDFLRTIINMQIILERWTIHRLISPDAIHIVSLWCITLQQCLSMLTWLQWLNDMWHEFGAGRPIRTPVCRCG